jgi:hypothetical protein
MAETRYAIEITVDICDLETEGEFDEIRDRIEDALGAWKPTVTATTREYDA